MHTQIPRRTPPPQCPPPASFGVVFWFENMMFLDFWHVLNRFRLQSLMLYKLLRQMMLIYVKLPKLPVWCNFMYLGYVKLRWTALNYVKWKLGIPAEVPWKKAPKHMFVAICCYVLLLVICWYLLRFVAIGCHLLLFAILIICDLTFVVVVIYCCLMLFVVFSWYPLS